MLKLLQHIRGDIALDFLCSFTWASNAESLTEEEVEDKGGDELAGSPAVSALP